MGRRFDCQCVPSHMRARSKAGGKLYYYYDHGGKPRKETALGPDYVEAAQMGRAGEGTDSD